jgi:hypothetical protein
LNSTILFFTTTLLFGSHIVYEQSSSDLGQSSSNFKDRILTFRSSFVNALLFEWKNVVKKKWISRGGYRRTLYRAWDMTFKNAYTYNGYCCCGFRYSNLSIYDQYCLFFMEWRKSFRQNMAVHVIQIKINNKKEHTKLQLTTSIWI